MTHKTREEAISLGIKVAPTKHRQTRRASWKKYWMEGVYGITIHIREDDDGRVDKRMLLSEIVGDSSVKPCVDEYATHTEAQPERAEHRDEARPERAEHRDEAQPERAEHRDEAQSERAEHRDGGVTDVACAQTSLSEAIIAPHPRLTPLGRIVDRKIREIGTHLHEEKVTVTHHVIMPTHIHMIVRVSGTLPWHLWNGSQKRWTLSDIIKGFEKGCTSRFYRMIEGETVDEILANPSKRRERKEPPMMMKNGQMMPVPGIWNKDGFNDKILMTAERHEGWLKYLCNNAYYWSLQRNYPKLFEHVLHLRFGDADYTAYGCMFLLGRTDRKQVMCHRLTRRGMLTDREWQLATQSMDVIKAYEADARKNKLGRFDRGWYRSTDPNSITPVDYIRTEAFRNQKTELLKACEEDDAVLVSPAISRGEQRIVEEALSLGYPVIKLVKEPITEKAHALNRDRDYCAKAQMLVLGPWEIKDYCSGKEARAQGDTQSAWQARAQGSLQNGSQGVNYFISKETNYMKFHNLNEMAAELCRGVKDFGVDTLDLEKCK